MNHTDDRALQRRMKKCGMTRLYYLIENGNKGEVKGFEQMVWTVKSQTQILDGFICHIFDGVGEAVKHLKRMTKIMAELYEVCPSCVCLSVID